MDKASDRGRICADLSIKLCIQGVWGMEEAPTAPALRLWLCHLTDRREMAFNTTQVLLFPQYLHRFEVEAGAGFSPAWAGTCALAKGRPCGYLT